MLGLFTLFHSGTKSTISRLSLFASIYHYTVWWYVPFPWSQPHHSSGYWCSCIYPAPSSSSSSSPCTPISSTHSLSPWFPTPAPRTCHPHPGSADTSYSWSWIHPWWGPISPSPSWMPRCLSSVFILLFCSLIHPGGWIYSLAMISKHL